MARTAAPQGSVSSSDASTSRLPKGTTVDNDATRSAPPPTCKPPGARNA